MASNKEMAARKKKRKKRSSKKFNMTKFFISILAFFAVVAGMFALCFGGFYYVRALQFDMDKVSEMPQRSVVYDRSKKEIGRIHGVNRNVVPIEQVAMNFRKAIIVREDIRFYEHGAIDWRGLARAIVRNVKDRSMTQGASTITMQLARNSFELSNGKEWYHELDRKILEIFVGHRIEKAYSKDKILENYINRIFWGHSMRGIEAASRAYLEKSAIDLTLSESAMLAGIVRGPNAFSPFRSVEAAVRERDTVLDRMVHYGVISSAEAKAAKAEELNIRPSSRRSSKNDYAIDAVTRELSYILEKENIRLGGLTIETTIDLPTQRAAERSVEKRLKAIESLSGYRHQKRSTWQASGKLRGKDPEYLQGAVYCIDNSDGGLLAAVGGRDANESRFNRAFYAKRQIGSVFKPFVFQAAYEQGLRPETFISDARLKSGEVDGATNNWNPGNSDGKYSSLIKTREALIRSKNTSSVRVGDYSGLKGVQRAGHLADFSAFNFTALDTGKAPSDATMYLGAWEATPEEVARAYSTFATLEGPKRPFVIKRIIDPSGAVVYKDTRIQLLDQNRMSKGATAEVSQILQEVNTTGTGSAVKKKFGLTYPTGGKTGTTDNYKDGWYAGYTSSVTCVVWVGLDRPKKVINKGYGSKLALPIWADTVKVASQQRGLSPESLDLNFPRTTVQLCRYSANAPTQRCLELNTAYQDSVPNDLLDYTRYSCSIHGNGDVVKARPKTEKQISSILEEGKKATGGFLKRIFGLSGEKRSKNKAIVLDETSAPPKAIPVREEAIKSVPARAVRARPAPESRPVRAVPVTPQRRQVQPRPRPVAAKPARAIPVRSQPQAVPPRATPVRAVPVREERTSSRAVPVREERPTRAIPVREDAPPRAVPILE